MITHGWDYDRFCRVFQFVCQHYSKINVVRLRLSPNIMSGIVSCPNDEIQIQFSDLFNKNVESLNWQVTFGDTSPVSSWHLHLRLQRFRSTALRSAADWFITLGLASGLVKKVWMQIANVHDSESFSTCCFLPDLIRLLFDYVFKLSSDISCEIFFRTKIEFVANFMWVKISDPD